MSSKMTRQRKWLLGVLGVGVAAVVVDRALLGGPDSVNASDEGPAVEAPVTDGGIVPAEETAAPVAASASGPIDLSEFARRLEAMPEAATGSLGRADAFEPPADWLTEPDEIGSVAAPEQPTSELSRAFSASHILNATIHDDGAAIAVLDGKLVSVGEVVDGFTLRRVSNRMTVWQAEATGEWVVLREVP